MQTCVLEQKLAKLRPVSLYVSVRIFYPPQATQPCIMRLILCAPSTAILSLDVDDHHPAIYAFLDGPR